ncbi:MAG: thymidine phosphorylase family protein [Saprospiraceae bacterium]|nr:thymidine phosphorylase family protein [Saprospiraceae bacterium]
MEQNKLKIRRLGIDTQEEYFVYLREDCPIVRSEGFESQTRVKVSKAGMSLVASLNIIRSDLLSPGEVSLSESAWSALNASENETLSLNHLPPLKSFIHVRDKFYGKRLSKKAFKAIVEDIYQGNYSKVHIAAFISACAGDHLDMEEITWLTESMVEAGKRIEWDNPNIVDKHCVGGIPGNRTTPIIISIVAAAGLQIPKTSSRAITSPAGTADTMETMTPVALSIDKIRQVVQKEGGCFVWGGAIELSPVDDLLIKVERAMDIDSEGQMVASVLSKKAAAGSKYIVIDIPVGPTAKVNSHLNALKLKYFFSVVGMALGLNVDIVISDGSQPVGVGIGPSLEAKDVLQVLRNDAKAPLDLKKHALKLAGTLLELGGRAMRGEGLKLAENILGSGAALEKFYAICKAQGGFKEPGNAPFTHDILSRKKGKVISINNHLLAKVAKLAGAPAAKTAGLEIMVKTGCQVSKEALLFRIHAESKGELQYALDFIEKQNEIIEIQ